MNEKSLIPSIRFAGFTDAWERRKLGEIAEFSKGAGYSKADIQPEGTPLILYGRLYTKYQTIISEIDTFAVPKSGSVYSKGGEVIVPASGETAEDISIASVVAKSGVMIGGDLNIVMPYQVLNPAFLAYSITYGEPHFKLSQYAQGKSVVHIHNADIKAVDIPFPKIQEQESICRLLGMFDRLITLHQRKYEKLLNIKKSMLDKMFPKNGELFPEVRFAGFTDAWERRKLGDICFEIVAGGDVDKEKLSDEGGFPVLANALTNDGIVGYYEKDYRIKAPAVTITGRGDVGHAKARKVDFTPVVRLLSLRTDHDVDFIENAINILKIVVESTGVPQLTVPQLEKYELCVPATIEEEKSIGNYFTQLDHLITLHQRKLKKLQNIKKACLEKMFV